VPSSYRQNGAKFHSDGIVFIQGPIFQFYSSHGLPCQISVPGCGFTALNLENLDNTNIIAPKRGGSLEQFLCNLQGLCASSDSLFLPNLVALAK